MKPKYEQARVLRRNLTPAEFILWESLRHRSPGAPVFRRQYAYGPYILDFYCIKARLAIEVDGLIHDREEQALKDEKRDSWLLSQGIYVYRIPARHIFETVGEVSEGIFLLAMERMREG